MNKTLSSREAFDRYETVKDRFPSLAAYSDYNRKPVQFAGHLGEVCNQFDAFVFDAFGVLNVGESPISGAVERVSELRSMGKRVFVLTNAASYAFPQVVSKFKRLGFDFSEDELVSSRAVCESHLAQWDTNYHWGVIGPGGFSPSELAFNATLLSDEAKLYDLVDGFLFLSAETWTDARQEMLVQSLKERRRPVVVANPDLVAPREIGLTVEPGYFAHDLMDRVADLEVTFHGKPFPSVYDHIEALLGSSIVKSRIAMVGDSLHTDIWGALVRGWSSVLVSDHGFLKGQDPMDAIGESGLYPTLIVPQI